MGFLGNLFGNRQREREVLEGFATVFPKARGLLGMPRTEAEAALRTMFDRVSDEGGIQPLPGTWAWWWEANSGLKVILSENLTMYVDSFQIWFPDEFGGLYVISSKKSDGLIETRISKDYDRPLTRSGLRVGQAIADATGFPFWKD